jgi:hypothetical protein
MSEPNPDQDFEQLRKLLACKKHEQPPPGYFTYFSDRVVAQIEIEERTKVSWWRAALAHFDARTALACGYGFAISSLLFLGFRVSQIFEATSAHATRLAAPWLDARQAGLSPTMNLTPAPAYANSPANFVEPPIPSTQTITPDPNLFRIQQPSGIVQTVNYSW